MMMSGSARKKARMTKAKIPRFFDLDLLAILWVISTGSSAVQILGDQAAYSGISSMECQVVVLPATRSARKHKNKPYRLAVARFPPALRLWAVAAQLLNRDRLTSGQNPHHHILNPPDERSAVARGASARSPMPSGPNCLNLISSCPCGLRSRNVQITHDLEARVTSQAGRNRAGHFDVGG